MLKIWIPTKNVPLCSLEGLIIFHIVTRRFINKERGSKQLTLDSLVKKGPENVFTTSS